MFWIFMMQICSFVDAKPAIQKRLSNPVVVHKHDSSGRHGHTMEEVKYIIANFEGVHLPRDEDFAHRADYRIPTTDDEEILAHLRHRNLISVKHGRTRFHTKPNARRHQLIPKHVLRNFRHIMANMPNDVEGSGYY